MSISTDELLYEYGLFHATVENTPNWFADWTDYANVDIQQQTNTRPEGLPYSDQRLLHAAIGLSTESAELLDVLKKRLYGKEKPIDAAAIANLREECGDIFYYLWLALRALNYPFDDMIRDNIAKLSKRYNKGDNTNA